MPLGGGVGDPIKRVCSDVDGFFGGSSGTWRRGDAWEGLDTYFHNKLKNEGLSQPVTEEGYMNVARLRDTDAMMVFVWSVTAHDGGDAVT